MGITATPEPPEKCEHHRIIGQYCMWCELARDLELSGTAVFTQDADGRVERISPEQFYLKPAKK